MGVEADHKLMIMDKYMAVEGREPAGWFVIYKVGEDLEDKEAPATKKREG